MRMNRWVHESYGCLGRGSSAFPARLPGRCPPESPTAARAAIALAVGWAFEAPGHPPDRSPDRARPRGLRLPFEAPFQPWPRRSPHRSAGRSAASRGIRRVSPPSTCFRNRARDVAVALPLDCRVQRGCRPRGFAPPRRFAVSGRRGLVASRCRSWGSPRFGRRIRDPVRRPEIEPPSPRRVSHPSKNPLAGSRTVSPRPLPPCGSADPPRARREGPPPAAMGSGPPIARRTSTHRSGRPPDRITLPLPGAWSDDRASRPLRGLAPPTSSCRLRAGLDTDGGRHASSWASFPFKVLSPAPRRAPPEGRPT